MLSQLELGLGVFGLSVSSLPPIRSMIAPLVLT
jgi:hypothetical protein